MYRAGALRTHKPLLPSSRGAILALVPVAVVIRQWVSGTAGSTASVPSAGGCCRVVGTRRSLATSLEAGWRFVVVVVA